MINKLWNGAGMATRLTLQQILKTFETEQLIPDANELKLRILLTVAFAITVVVTKLQPQLLSRWCENLQSCNVSCRIGVLFKNHSNSLILNSHSLRENRK